MDEEISLKGACMSSPRVSVVLTCYNYGRFLSGAIESVLSQTYHNTEIVLVDDGSTDNTQDVALAYQSHPQVIYIRQNNAGQANAKNTGIKNASGEYIAFLDADDLWHPRKLEKQMDLFRDKAIGVVYCMPRFIDENSEELFVEHKEEYLQPRKGKVAEWLFLDNFVPFSSSVVKKQCFDKFGLFDESIKMGIDWDLWLRISTYYKFDFVEEPLFLYRIGHGDQMSKNLVVRQECSDIIMSRFIENFPNAVSKTTIKKAYYYTHCNRGNYFREHDIKKSFKHFCEALKIEPLHLKAYKGIVKNFLYFFK